MTPVAATATFGLLTVSGVGSVFNADTTVLEAVSIATIVSLVPYTISSPPSGVSARLLAGTPTITRPVMVLLDVAMTATEPSRFDTYALLVASTTSVGESPTFAMIFTAPVDRVITETLSLAVLVT